MHAWVSRSGTRTCVCVCQQDAARCDRSHECAPKSAGTVESHESRTSITSSSEPVRSMGDGSSSTVDSHDSSSSRTEFFSHPGLVNRDTKSPRVSTPSLTKVGDAGPVDDHPDKETTMLTRRYPDTPCWKLTAGPRRRTHNGDLSLRTPRGAGLHQTPYTSRRHLALAQIGGPTQ